MAQVLTQHPLRSPPTVGLGLEAWRKKAWRVGQSAEILLLLHLVKCFCFVCIAFFELLQLILLLLHAFPQKQLLLSFSKTLQTNAQFGNQWILSVKV